MAINRRRQGGLATANDFDGLHVALRLPPADHSMGAEGLFADLVGSRIVALGAPDSDEIDIEGGGLILDYEKEGVNMRVVFGFNENGMWIEYAGRRWSTASQ